MLALNDGRSELWQWDTGRTLAVDADCTQVHFSNKVFGRSIDVDVAGGVAIIPDVLLQTDKDLNVWAFVGTAENGYTKISKTFKVNRRNKPADYVFTPVEQTTIAEIAAIAKSVRDDADAGLFDGKPGKDGLDGVDGKDGEPGKDGTSATHSWNGTVLTITSASGTSSADLKGDKGEKGDNGGQGIPGPAGYTPEYGVDYGTPEQIAGIAQQAAALIDFDANQLKDDLADKMPKSPADWEPWTAEEQAAARERIGIPVDYVLISEIVLDEPVRVVSVDSLNLKSILILMEVSGTIGKGYVYTYVYSENGRILYFPNIGIPRTNKRYVANELRDIGPMYLGLQNDGQWSFTDTNVNMKGQYVPKNGEKITQISIYCTDLDETLTAGSKITIYGVRA